MTTIEQSAQQFAEDNFSLIVPPNHGVYSGQYFAENFPKYFEELPEAREVLLAGPDHEDYADVMEEIVLVATRYDGHEVFSLHVDESGAGWFEYSIDAVIEWEDENNEDFWKAYA